MLPTLGRILHNLAINTAQKAGSLRLLTRRGHEHTMACMDQDALLPHSFCNSSRSFSAGFLILRDGRHVARFVGPCWHLFYTFLVASFQACKLSSASHQLQMLSAVAAQRKRLA